jgi:hypothetical protein
MLRVVNVVDNDPSRSQPANRDGFNADSMAVQDIAMKCRQR